MNSFTYTRAGDVATAVRVIAQDGAAKFIAGGTNLLDLMKENVTRPSRLIDITRLPLNSIEVIQDGGLRLGALVTNTDVAYTSKLKRDIRCSRKRFWRARPHNSATWRRRVAI